MTDEIALQSPKKRRRLDDLDSGNGAIEPTIPHYTNDGIITSLTQELERLDSRRVTLLIFRSRALADKGRLTDAVSDALKAIEYGPTLADGYLAAGEIYCIQGKQREAVDIYECGLRMVLPSDWPILYERRKSATEQMNRRIDFVANLPFEVTEAIFAQFQDHDHKQYIDCANTSRLWRSIVVYQCPMLWRTITISKRSLYDRDSAARLLPSVGRHVQHLVLNDVPDHVIRTLVTLVEDKKVASVKEMTLASPIREFKSAMPPLITTMRNTLTKLTIRLETIKFFDTNPTFPLDPILSQCPSLEFLSLQSRDIIRYRAPPSPPPESYRLLGLCFDVLHADGILEHLLPHCPQLHTLFVRDCITPNLASLIHQHCLQLRYLRTPPRSYHHRHHRITPNDDDRLSHDIPKDVIGSKPGLHILEHYAPITQEFLPLLARSKDTLKCLRLSADEDIIIDSLGQLVFCHLTDLSLMIMPEETEAAASIILQCPMLEQVDLCATLAAEPTSLHDICNSLTLHDNVRILKFEGFESNTAGTDLERLFTHYANSESYKVHQVSIIKCESWQICESFLEPLACIATLRKIEVRGSFSYTERDSFALCVQRLKALPNLRSLAFEDMTCIRNEDLVRLVQIDGLESLELVDINVLSTKLVYILADNVSPTLKVCKIEKSYVTKEAMAYLESKLKGQ